MHTLSYFVLPHCLLSLSLALLDAENPATDTNEDLLIHFNISQKINSCSILIVLNRTKNLALPRTIMCVATFLHQFPVPISYESACRNKNTRKIKAIETLLSQATSKPFRRGVKSSTSTLIY